MWSPASELWHSVSMNISVSLAAAQINKFMFLQKLKQEGIHLNLHAESMAGLFILMY